MLHKFYDISHAFGAIHGAPEGVEGFRTILWSNLHGTITHLLHLSLHWWSITDIRPKLPSETVTSFFLFYVSTFWMVWKCFPLSLLKYGKRIKSPSAKYCEVGTSVTPFCKPLSSALGSCDRATWAKCDETEKTNKIQQSDVYYQLLSQHVSGIIMPIFRRTKTVCYCIRCTTLVLLDVVGSVCGALRCRMRALLASYNAAPHNRYSIFIVYLTTAS